LPAEGRAAGARPPPLHRPHAAHARHLAGDVRPHPRRQAHPSDAGCEPQMRRAGWVRRSADPTRAKAPREACVGFSMRPTSPTKSAPHLLLVALAAFVATASHADPLLPFTAAERAAIS